MQARDVSPETVLKFFQQNGFAERVGEILERYATTIEDVVSGGRQALVVLARREICALLYDRIPSYSRVAWVLGMDHTSVMYAVRKHRAALLAS